MDLDDIRGHATPVRDLRRVATGYQQITSLGTAAALTVPEGSSDVWLQAEDQDLRLRFDGTNPTASAGMLLSAASDGVWFSGDLSLIRVIETTSAGKLNAAYFR